MAYLISWVLWILYTLAATAAMYAFLSFAETTVSRLLGCRRYYIYDYEGILSKGGRFRYLPQATPEILRQPPVAKAAVEAAAPVAVVAAPAIDRYEAYRRRVRQVLDAKWSFLPGHVLDTAMDMPRAEVLAMAPTADGWAGRVLHAASGWLAADTGLPASMVQHVLTVRDLEDQLRLADMEMVLADMAAEYPRVRDLTGTDTVAAVFSMLRAKGRPLCKASDYVKTAAAYGAMETTDPALLRMFSPCGLTDEQWMSLRYRARDF